MENPFTKPSRFFGLMLSNQFFLVPFILFIVLATATIGVVGNVELFLFQNQFYSYFADLFFLKITHLGDAALAFAIVFLLLRVSIRDSLTFLVVTVLLMFLTTLLKRYIFPEIGRPVEFFEFQKVIRLANGYYPPGLYSFPSGHSATVFSIFCYLSLLTKNRTVQFLMFLLALTVSYSRIYLSAHFPVDVLAGSLIGVSITVFAFYFSRKITNHWIDRKLVFKPRPSFS
ncbi:MAG: phosphatase PAP2 family protein [Prolixibacteraceae bacterium]|nr:phosphatase PAP2 family protein [Prolixibacteraceae bacterium]